MILCNGVSYFLSFIFPQTFYFMSHQHSLRNFVELALGWKFIMVSKELTREPREQGERTKLKNASQGIFTKSGQTLAVPDANA